jgi:predicted metal-dependent peptidase
MPEPIFAPGRAGRGAGTVVIGADTSGSMGEAEIALYFAEMFGILEDVRPKRLVVMWCDAAVGRVDEVEDASELLTLRGKGAPGGGGTDFRPVFDEIKKLGIEPDCLVFFTDGYGTFPAATEATYPVLWGSVACKPEHYPFGDVVQLPRVS